MKKTLYTLLISLSAMSAGCIEDGFTTDPGDAPVAGVETLDLGTVFTARRTNSFRFSIHNRASKSVAVSHLAMAGPDAPHFRLCVDGFSGTEFTDVEIRAKDSILILVDALLPEGAGPGAEYTAAVEYTACGVRQSVPVKATGRDAVRLTDAVIDSDTHLSADLPYIVEGELTVLPGATLTLSPGTEMCFHDGASMNIKGALHSLGTAEKPVSLAGDRTGNVVADISFDIMSRQWEGINITDATAPSMISHTDMRNTWTGLVAANSTVLLINSRLHNAAAAVLTAENSTIDAAGCEFAEAGVSLVVLAPATKAAFNHCTFANNYLFSAIEGPAIAFTEPEKTEARITNSIISGLGTELSHADLTGFNITFERCLLRSAGSDDANFLRCMWDTDPMYHTDRQAYIFDYRLRPESPAATAADPALTDPRTAADRYGIPRGPSPAIGAYAMTPP